MSVHFHSAGNLTNLRKFFLKANERSFSVIHLNIRSLQMFWHHFQASLTGIAELVDAFVLTEINIDDCMTDHFHLPGYHARFFTRVGRREGGIAIFFKSHWAAAAMERNFTAAEFLALRLDSAGSSVSLHGIYRPPSENHLCFLGELRDNLAQLLSCSNICLIGYFIIDLLKSSKLIVSKYLNLVAEHGIEFSVVYKAPREEMILGKSAASCLDHVLIRAIEYEDVNSVLITEKIADHYFVGCQISPPEV